jgi:hypothetical protein
MGSCLVDAFEQSAAISQEIAAALSNKSTTNAQRQVLLKSVATGGSRSEPTLRDAIQVLLSSETVAVHKHPLTNTRI